MPIRLDEQMNVIRLHREMHQPRAQVLFRGMKGGEHKPRKGLVSEAGQSRPEPHSDVHRMPRFQRGTAQVRRPGLFATRLSA